MVAIPESMPAHVSMENELPRDLYDSMVQFIGNHPDWDQYRLVQSAIAGFLHQQGCQDRAVVRHYLNGLFRRPAQVEFNS